MRDLWKIRDTLNRDENDGGQAGSDAVDSLAKVIAFVRLLNVIDREGAILHADIGIAQFQIGVITRRVPCETE